MPLEVHPEQSEPGQPGDQLAGKGPGRVVLGHLGQEALTDEVAHRELDEPLLVAEKLIDA